MMSGDGIPVATHEIVMLSVSLTVICGSSIVANGETEETKKGIGSDLVKNDLNKPHLYIIYISQYNAHE